MAFEGFDNLPKHENIIDIAGVVSALETVTRGLVKEKPTGREIAIVLRVLKNAFVGLTEAAQKHSEEQEVVKIKTRETEDELDEYKQKNLRGKLVITASRDKPSSLKKQNELSAEGSDALEKHIIALAKEKYDEVIAPEDIASCHFLPSGGIFLSLWNMKPGSAFQRLTSKIKSKKQKKEVNIYFNFMLTKRRSELLFEVRKLKREEKIARFYSDENGVISIKVKEDDLNMKLSSFSRTKTSPVMTYRVPELLKIVSESQPQQ